MIRTHYVRASLARPQRVAALIITGMLLATGCSEGGITPPPSASPPTIAAAVVRDTSDAAAARAGILTGALTNGGNHTGTISVAQQVDTWTFTATQGQYLIVAIGETSGSADFTPWIRLVDPNSITIGNNWNVAAAQIGVQAPTTGTYTVLAATNDPGNDATGTYNLIATELPGSFIVSPGDQGGAMTNGANHPGTIFVGDVDLWSFSATQSDNITLAIGKVSGSADFTPWIRLIGPNGALIGNTWNTAAAQLNLAAPLTGTYTVVVSTNDPGNDANGDYTLTLAKGPGSITISPGDQGGPMTNGANHAGTIGVGDLDAWTFTATQGDYIMLAVGEVTGSSDFMPWIRLVSPTGALIGNNWNVLAAQIGITAPATGSYLVIISTNDAGNDATGDYNLTLAKGPGGITISPGDQGGPINNGARHTGTVTVGDLDAWTFAANQGDAIIVAIGKVSGSPDFTPWIRLITPTGVLIANTWNSGAVQFQVTAPTTGNYLLVASTNDPGNDATGDYTLTLAKAPGAFITSPGDEGGTATNGGNNTGTIDVGDLDMYSFTANQGLPFAVSIGEVTGSVDFTPWLRIIAPNGQTVGNNWNVAATQVSLLAPQTGTYTIIVSTNDPGNDATGDYRLVLQKGGAFVTPPGDEGGAMINGANQTGTIVVGDLDRWTFTANQNDQIALSVAEVTGNDFTPWIRLVSPSGVVLGNTWTTLVAQVNVAAPETGTYTVAIGTNDPGNDGTGDYVLTLAKGPGSFVIPPGDQGGAISNGGHPGTITLGDLDLWTVNANSGSPIMLTVSKVSGTADYTPWIRLVAPNGQMLGNNWNPTSASVNVSAPSTGTYTIIIGTNDPGNDATGTYSLTVSGVNLAPQPQMVPVVGQLNANMTPRPKSYGADEKK